MAKEKTSTVGSALKTTIVFTPKTVLEELAKAKRNFTKRSQSLSGTFGETIAKAVEEKHLDRKAFGMALQLDALDDERLHLTVHNLLHYLEVLGVMKRASAQEEMFTAGETAEPVGTFSDPKDKDEKGKGGLRVAASEGRRTGEQAGAAE